MRAGSLVGGRGDRAFAGAKGDNVAMDPSRWWLYNASDEGGLVRRFVGSNEVSPRVVQVVGGGVVQGRWRPLRMVIVGLATRSAFRTANRRAK